MSGQRKILVVEDDPHVAAEMCERLDLLGYATIGPAPTIAEAECLLAMQTPAAAVLDGDLRGLSSVPLAIKLAARGVPVVFCTGADFIKNLPPELVAAPVLIKPFSNALLESALKLVMA